MNNKNQLSDTIRRELTVEFARRCDKNPRYSLRGFANSINVDSSYLSKIMNGKRNLSGISLQRFAEKLEFSPALSEACSTQMSKSSFTSLDIDKFRIISDWHHYAILEMTKLDHFQADAKWIAAYLGISHTEALSAIQRLQDCKLLEIASDGKWMILNNTTTKHKFSDVAFKQLQKQILEQSIQALFAVPIQDRDQSSITMCVDKRRLERAKLKLKKFRRELMVYLEGGAKKDAVYQLSLSLFPIENFIKSSYQK